MCFQGKAIFAQFPPRTQAERELEKLLRAKDEEIDLALGDLLIAADVPQFRDMTRETYFKQLDAMTEQVRQDMAMMRPIVKSRGGNPDTPHAHCRQDDESSNEQKKRCIGSPTTSAEQSARRHGAQIFQNTGQVPPSSPAPWHLRRRRPKTTAAGHSAVQWRHRPAPVASACHGSVSMCELTISVFPSPPGRLPIRTLDWDGSTGRWSSINAGEARSRVSSWGQRRGREAFLTIKSRRDAPDTHASAGATLSTWISAAEFGLPSLTLWVWSPGTESSGIPCGRSRIMELCLTLPAGRSE